MAKIGDIQEVTIAELKPYEKNAKMHSEEQVNKIAESIKEFGFLNPCLIDKDKNIIAGHGRVEACKQLGWDKVPCLYVEGLTEAQRRAYILADNKLTEMGDWNTELVSEELEELRAAGYDIELTGFSIDDILISDDMAAEISEEEVEEMADNQPRIHKGEIWMLGRHRLMCGDSTSEDDVARLVGGGTVDLLLTDPPYNVAVENSQGMTIENDNLSDEDFYEFLKQVFSNARDVLKEGGAFYVWYASKTGAEFITALKDADLIPHQQLIWVKSQFTLGRQDYKWQHEPCLYGWKEGAGHYFIDCYSFSTVFGDKKTEELTREELIEKVKEYDSLTTAIHEKKPAIDSLHPTMKPVTLFKKLIRNSSEEGDVVLDLFGGSGTTLIACEEMGRTCYTMEYDDHYAEVIIQRWEEQTGQKAVLSDE